MGGGEGARFLQLTAFQQTAGKVAGSLPFSSRLGQWVVVGCLPAVIRFLRRFHQSVVRKLVPGIVATQHGTHEEGGVEQINAGVGQTGCVPGAAIDQAASLRGCDEFRRHPVTQRSFAQPCLRQNSGQSRLIEPFEGLVYVAGLLEIIKRDLTRVAGGTRTGACVQAVPELAANDLQLYGFNVLAQDRFPRRGCAHLAKIVYQLFGHAGGKRTSAQRCRFAHRFKRRLHPHALHVKTRASRSLIRCA